MAFGTESSDTDNAQSIQCELNPLPRKEVIPSYTCETCKKRFSRKDNFDRHIFGHTGVKAFECKHEGCDKKYTNSSHLKRHIRSNHEEKKPKEQFVKCKHPTCSRFFTTEASMSRHHETLHIIGKPYQCPDCPESFRRKLQLKHHIYKHTGEFPHNCDKCSKGFTSLRSLRSHKQAHLPYKCEHCPKLFEHWTDHVAHKKLEHRQEHKCEQCGKVFNIKMHLKYHARTHQCKDDREVLECPFEKCPRYYFHKQNLSSHIKSKHEGSKKFICSVDECRRQLCTKQRLNQHMKLHESASRNVQAVMKKPRPPSAKRKDFGTKKKSTASQIARVEVEPIIERKILEGKGNELIIHPSLFVDSASESEFEVEKIVQSQLKDAQDEIKRLLKS